MPLPNRITPFGDFIATPARGLLMGNRGGRLHDDEGRLGACRWASKRWIYLLPTRFQRPASQCLGRRLYRTLLPRRGDRLRRRPSALFSGQAQRAPAAAIDRLLHTERLAGAAKRKHRRRLDTLPDGAMIARAGEAFAVHSAQLLRWTPAGYSQGVPRPSATEVDVLTPSGIIDVLAAGYAPFWHASAAGRSF